MMVDEDFSDLEELPKDHELRAGSLAYYVAYRRRHGDSDYTFHDALILHRRQCLENLRDDHDQLWADRARRLDRLAAKRNINLSGEIAVASVEVEIARAEEKARRENAEWDKQAAVRAMTTEHTFADGVVCACGETHGHLLEPATVAHGLHHLRAWWNGASESERDRAKAPWDCDCGYKGAA